MRIRLLALALLGVTLVSVSWAQVTVTAHLTDGQSHGLNGSFLRFELWNCGANFPINTVSPLIIVQRTVDMKANGSGFVGGQIIPNDQILCGNVASTRWLVTAMKDAATPLNATQRYNILSGSPFDPATAQPDTVSPPSPGFTVIYSNPVKNQSITQPPTTVMSFFGTFDFSGATVIGLSGGSGGGGGCTTACDAASIQGIPVNASHGVFSSLPMTLIWNGSQYTLQTITGFLPLTGGTLSGSLTLAGDPVANLQAATKHYVDLLLASKADLVSGLVPTNELGSGTANSLTCLFGDHTWKVCGTGGNSFAFQVNGTSYSAANLNGSTPGAPTGFINGTFAADGSGNTTLGVPWGSTSNTFARGDLAILKDALGNASIPGTFAASEVQTTGLGPWSVSGGFGLLTPAPGGSTMLGFGPNGHVQVSEDGGPIMGLAHLDSSLNVIENALTATEFAGTPTVCSGGNVSSGIDRFGNSTCVSTGAAAFQVNGVALTSAGTVNFQDSTAFNGLTATFSNPSAGNVKLGFSGTLGNAGLTNPSVTVNGTTCTLGSTCLPPPVSGNCAATGTAASPSVVSCTAAAAGAFSCATNASAATCTVNTTAVTANSEIFVHLVSDEGTRLSVTCNTVPTTVPAIYVATKTAGTGFTINMPTIATNPACFDYQVIN